MTSTSAISLSKFTEMNRHFAELMELHKKKKLMAEKKICSIFTFIRFASSTEFSKIADSFLAEKICGQYDRRYTGS
jgi:hypothetical protein